MPKQERVEKTNVVSGPKPKSGQDCMAQHKVKCKRIVQYMCQGKHRHGLTKNEQ